MTHLQHTHDLRLPAWGPYTKTYMGISHIPSACIQLESTAGRGADQLGSIEGQSARQLGNTGGQRFDLSVFPGFYRGKVLVPNVKWESGHHPWESAPDLSYYSHRHELEWKDRVYVDVSFSQIDEHSRLIRCQCVNQTDLPQTLVLHYMASLTLAPLKTNSDEPLQPSLVSLPESALWIGALDYIDLRYATPRPSDNLVYDGWYRGESRAHGFVDGQGVGCGFGREPGDTLIYEIAVPRAIDDAVLLIRCRLTEDGSRTELSLSGLTHTTVTLAGQRGFRVVELLIGDITAGSHPLQITSLGGEAIEIDGLVVCRASDRPQVHFEQATLNTEAEMLPGPAPNSLRLRYEQTSSIEYGLKWGFAPFQVRQFYGDELDNLMRRTVHQHTRAVLYDQWAAAAPRGHFVNIFMRPIGLEPHSQRAINGLVCSGTPDEITRRLSRFDLCRDAEPVYQQARRRIVDMGGYPDQPYTFSQEKMAATVLTNVVYPVYTRGTYIRHNTPGRWWDSLYTWDSGFIGLGLLELDRERAIDCLNAYLTEPGDPHAAFIHHGSMVPVQFYLFFELWNREPDRTMLAYFYPRLKQYYAFMAGKRGSSTTRTLKSNLLKTWDYFYNSGGWDDYPPQVYIHREQMESTVAPVVTTAQCIRIARIMQMAASEMGIAQDVQEYEQDIERFAQALQNTAWDQEAGYFSYVVHDEQGKAIDVLRHESGENYNRGLDGAYPLVAGICTPEQEKRLFDHLQDPKRHWTAIGLSTVDQSASYFRRDGYWNGAVWMPHQWFFWKTCLDLGRPEFAWQIAKTGLDLWRREVEASYNCYEHFIVETGRGAGWHQFGGLSTPVLSWYGAHFRPGRLTTGFDVWVRSLDVSSDHRRMMASLRTYGHTGRTLHVLVSMDATFDGDITWNGERCVLHQLHPGVYAVALPCGQKGTLKVGAYG
ncbi:MAG: hypothetical protein JXA89_16530 [Anaerolineae bacterium]|nr:hypothetical protein [Anaerolineae bacterium]